MANKYRDQYTSRRISTAQRDYWKTHPIWRGVGFALLVLIPLISYAACEVLIRQNGIHHWFALPADLLVWPGNFLYDLTKDSLALLKVILTFSFIVFFYAVFLLFSTLINGLFGVSSRKDPYYVPPLNRRNIHRR